MIKLLELLHSVQQEEKDGLIAINDWRWPDVDHLVTMGFEFADDFHMHTQKEPKITIYKKKDKNNDGKPVSFFFIEEKNRKPKRFETFNDVIDFFDHYPQKEFDRDK